MDGLSPENDDELTAEELEMHAGLSEEEQKRLEATGFITLPGGRFIVQRGRAEQVHAAAIDAFRDSHLLGLFWPNAGNPISATGFLVEYREHCFLATCGHALRHIDLAEVYLSPSQSFPLSAVVPRSERCRVWDDSSMDLDVGAILLDEATKVRFEGLGKSFYPIADSSLAYQVLERQPKPTKGTLFFVPGFPNRLFRRLQIADIGSLAVLGAFPNLALYRKTILLNVCAVQFIPRTNLTIFELHDLDPQQFALVFDSTHQVGARVADTTGCSGGPVLMVTNESASRGDATGLTLVGIQAEQTKDPENEAEAEALAPLGNKRILFMQHIRTWCWLADELIADSPFGLSAMEPVRRRE